MRIKTFSSISIPELILALLPSAGSAFSPNLESLDGNCASGRQRRMRSCRVSDDWGSGTVNVASVVFASESCAAVMQEVFETNGPEITLEIDGEYRQ